MSDPGQPSVIIDNPLFDAAKPTAEWLPKLVEFLNNLSKLCDVTVTESGLTVFHIIPDPEKFPVDITPSVIIKFNHFRDKNGEYKNRRMLKHLFHPLYNRKIRMKETLPQLDAFFQKLACIKELIAVTNNCKVSVMCKNK